MALEITVPRLGREMESGRIAEWYLPDGAKVHRGEPVFRLETDYVAFEVEAEEEGVVRREKEAGSDVAPGEVAGRIVLASDREPGAPTAEEPPLRIRRAAEPAIVRRTGSLQMARDAIPDWEPERPRASVPPAAPLPLRPSAYPAPRPTGPRPVNPPVEPRAVAEEAETSPVEPIEMDQEIPGGVEETPAETTETAIAVQDVRLVATARAATLVMRTTVALTEVQKMCAQLTREWEATHLTCTLEDVLARAIARTLDAELLGAAVDGRRLRVVTQDLHSARVVDLREPGTRLFRELVSERQALGEQDSGREWPQLTTYDGTGVEEAHPRLQPGDVAGFTLGDKRDAADGPVATFTLGYAEDMVAEAQSANFVARVRELIEAPYALLAE